MANRTVKDAHTIKGTNPQYLVEKIIRSRIYDCKYWKEECFALTGKIVYNMILWQAKTLTFNTTIRNLIFPFYISSGASCR